MPVYTYRAITRTGVIVKNRVEASSRQALIKGLKKSNILPISIEQAAYISNKQVKKQKKNITNIEDIKKDIFCKNRTYNTKRYSCIYTKLLSTKKSKF